MADSKYVVKFIDHADPEYYSNRIMFERKVLLSVLPREGEYISAPDENNMCYTYKVLKVTHSFIKYHDELSIFDYEVTVKKIEN